MVGSQLTSMIIVHILFFDSFCIRRYVCGDRSVDFRFGVPEGVYDFAGVKFWQVAKRTKVLSASMKKHRQADRGQDKNQKKKNRPVEAIGEKRQFAIIVS